MLLIKQFLIGSVTGLMFILVSRNLSHCFEVKFLNLSCFIELLLSCEKESFLYSCSCPKKFQKNYNTGSFSSADRGSSDLGHLQIFKIIIFSIFELTDNLFKAFSLFKCYIHVRSDLLLDVSLAGNQWINHQRDD